MLVMIEHSVEFQEWLSREMAAALNPFQEEAQLTFL